MKEFIFEELVSNNPRGLMEIRPALTLAEYNENKGFGLKRVLTIFQSAKIHESRTDYFVFPNRNSLKKLFKVRESDASDLQFVYIAEVIKRGMVYCYLVLSDEAFAKIVRDSNQYVLQVHQLYSRFWQRHLFP
ncbi:MAG: hypothetical protein WCZ15_03040 [Patescibacteria group bacterium]